MQSCMTVTGIILALRVGAMGDNRISMGRTMPTKKLRPSGVTVTRTKSGGIRMKAFGPSAPDLRAVVPGLLGAKPAPRQDEEIAPAPRLRRSGR